MKDDYGDTVLRHAVYSDNPIAIDVILALHPASNHVRALLGQSRDVPSTLHCVASHAKHESMKHILTLLPESQRLSAVNMTNHRGKTVLHEAIRANNAECVHTLLATYPKSELLPAAIMQDNEGRTVLHYLAREHNLSGIKLILSHQRELELQQVVCIQSADGQNMLHYATESLQCRLHRKDSESESIVDDILALLPKSQRLQLVKMQDGRGRTVLHNVVRSGHVESIKTVLSLYPKSERLQGCCCKIQQDRLCCIVLLVQVILNASGSFSHCIQNHTMNTLYM